MKKRMLIGVVITDCHVDFQGEILRGIISQAFRSNCDLAILSPLNNFSVDTLHKFTEKTIFDLILSENIDGLIYDRNTFCSDEIKKHIDELCSRSEKPVMLLDYNNHNSFETTSVDDCSAFEILTNHLIEVHGLKKIYCITGHKNNFTSEERLQGYMIAMKNHGLYFDKSYYCYGDFWKTKSKEFANKIISGELERPEAIVCGNDVMAVTITETLIANGIKVPEDIAVTGYDASSESYDSNPSITSYSRPNFQLGAESFRRLYRIITGKICSKVPNENGCLRIGKSCGCNENPNLKRSIKRLRKIEDDHRTNLFYGDMLFDITNSSSASLFAERLDNYTYFIYKMNRMYLCLTKKYIDSIDGNYSGKLDFHCGDDMYSVLAKSTVRREPDQQTCFSSDNILPCFNSEKRHPSAYYITPLHYNDQFFGYSALSFGKVPMSFSTVYMLWINYVNIALEQVLIKGKMSTALKDSTRHILVDTVTGLPNKAGIEQEFVSRINAGTKNCECISIEITGIKKIYYLSGEENCNRIVRKFSELLLSCLKEDELCGRWSESIITIITEHCDRGEEIFREFSEKIRNSRFSGENCSIDFSLGICTAELPEMNLKDCIYKATVNKNQSYSTSESSENPQFEKLCMLRNKIMKNPEMQWNISEIADSLYLSKSYLQKMYKTYFRKSIIEEMIYFRIEKSKDMLLNTSLTVTDIARECGYSSYNYFVRQFRDLEGQSPSEYRTHNLQ